MKIGIVANGSWDKEWGREELSRAEWVICADGGGNGALASGRMPNVLIGDLDSISRENLKYCQEAGVEIIVYPKEKDETDLELAFQYVRRKFYGQEQHHENKSIELCLYGFSGGRADHFMGNLALMLAFAKLGLTIKAKDRNQTLWIIGGEEAIDGEEGQEISLVPLTEQALVSTTGLYYPLHRSVLYQTSPRGVSNVFTGSQATVTVHEGWLLVVLLT